MEIEALYEITDYNYLLSHNVWICFKDEEDMGLYYRVWRNSTDQSNQNHMGCTGTLSDLIREKPLGHCVALARSQQGHTGLSTVAP